MPKIIKENKIKKIVIEIITSPIIVELYVLCPIRIDIKGIRVPSKLIFQKRPILEFFFEIR